MKRNRRDAIRTITVVLIFVTIFHFYINVWNQDTNDMFKIDITENTENSAFTSLWKRKIFETNSTVPVVMPFPPTTAATVHATPTYTPALWPDLNKFGDDRILAQMGYRPISGADQKRNMLKKKILLIDGFRAWGVTGGQKTFIDHECPTASCMLTANRWEAKSADAVLFQTNPQAPWYRRPPNQVWILYMLESPYHTPDFRQHSHLFNWTASYRRDSDIVTPYEKFVKYSKPPNNIKELATKNYAAGKTRKVAWFVSNCHAQNKRLQFAKELQKYIQVDIFGKCGNRQCSKNNNKCSEIINQQYKFYLAFENSNCRDYITEKFFVMGLQHDVIPIVMGAAPEDYERAAPHYSYIHVDHYGSPKILADYLDVLDSNDDLYNEYFRWKGTGEFINTKFWCRLCSLLYDTTREHSSYGDLNEWWRGKDVCIGSDGWRKHPRHKPYISGYHGKRS